MPPLFIAFQVTCLDGLDSGFLGSVMLSSHYPGLLTRRLSVKQTCPNLLSSHMAKLLIICCYLVSGGSQNWCRSWF